MPYDYKSVMHYEAYAFAIDRDVMTIEPKQRGITLGQRKRLSDIDVKKKSKFCMVVYQDQIKALSQLPIHSEDM